MITTQLANLKQDMKLDGNRQAYKLLEQVEELLNSKIDVVTLTELIQKQQEEIKQLKVQNSDYS